MSARIDHAMLLAAGLGTRLRPLTLSTPKPLLPLNGTPLIDHQLRYLAQAGIRHVVINLHHLGQMIRDHVQDGAALGLAVQYSEEPVILGTGGGVKRAAPLFHDRPFLVLNSDALIDCNLEHLIQTHLDSGEAATMVVKTLATGERYTPIGVDAAGFITTIGAGNHFFTGLSIINYKILELLPPRDTTSCLVRDGIVPFMRQGGRVCAYVHTGYFNDMGTPERYKQAQQDIDAGRFRQYR